MAFFAALFAVAVALASVTKGTIAAASPFRVQETFCGHYDTRANGQIILYNNHWGSDNDKTGTQCTTVTGLSSAGAISYSTTPKWAGTAWQVKSFTNIETIVKQPLRAYEIQSILAKCQISTRDSLAYDRSPMYNAAFDLFFGPSATSAATYEVMIWVLARNGATPLQQFGVFDMMIDGRKWALHDGSNGPQRVLSFTTSGEINAVNLDLKHFVDAAVQHAMPQNQYLVKVQGGFEYFHGESTLSVSNYQVTILKANNAQPVPTRAPYVPTIAKGVGCTAPGLRCVTNTFCMPWTPSYSQCIETPAQCPVQLLNTGIGGANIRTIKDISPGQCCSRCATTSGCKAYTFVNTNPDRHPVCYLKSASTPRMGAKGVVSAEVKG